MDKGTAKTLPLTRAEAKKTIEKWKQETPPSNGSVRLQLCCDLTIVQGALLGGWQIMAWILGLHALDPHQVALYGGVYCIQFLALLLALALLSFEDSWNNVVMNNSILRLIKGLLGVAVNGGVRAAVWLLVTGMIAFSGINLRLVRLNSLTNIIISSSALANYIVLLHVSGAFLDEFVHGNSDVPAPRPKNSGILEKLMVAFASYGGKMLAYSCRAFQLALHLWPIADSILISCLMALVAFLARRSLDSAWRTTESLKRARDVTKDTRHLIWPSTVLLGQFCYEVVKSILSLSHEYALLFLLSTSNIGQVKEEGQKEKSKEKVDNKDEGKTEA